jgi:hypothetical protein
MDDNVQQNTGICFSTRTIELVSQIQGTIQAKVWHWVQRTLKTGVTTVKSGGNDKY